MKHSISKKKTPAKMEMKSSLPRLLGESGWRFSQKERRLVNKIL
jgi:hypothetical protein